MGLIILTVKEFYEYCKKKGIEDYQLASAGVPRGFAITKDMIEVKDEIPDEMKGEVWV